MGEVALMNAFIRSSEEIVGYSLEGRTTTLSTFRTAAMNVVELYERYLVARPYRDEERQQIWPAPVDVALMNLFLSFHRDCSLEGSDTVFSAAAQFNVDVDSLQESGSSFEQWTADALSFQSTLLSVLQLRFLCGLRGVKPSQLLGPVVSDLLSLNLKLRDRLTPSTAWKEVQTHHPLYPDFIANNCVSIVAGFHGGEWQYCTDAVRVPGAKHSAACSIAEPVHCCFPPLQAVVV